MKTTRVLLWVVSMLVAIVYPPASLSKTRAASTDVVIYQVQMGGAGSGTASQELIILYNAGLSDVNVTNWCVKYSSASDASGFQTCLTPEDEDTELWLSASSFLSFATNEFSAANAGFVADKLFAAGVAASGGHLRLMNAEGIEIDKLGYGTAVSPETSPAPSVPGGSTLRRSLSAAVLDSDNNQNDFSIQSLPTELSSGLYEVALPPDICPNIVGRQVTMPLGYMHDIDGECHFDICPNLDELQVTIPIGYEINEMGDCDEVILEDRTIFITELYPDAPSYDTGNEFIELYNPHDKTVSLNGYRLQVGPSFTKEFIFTLETVPSNSYAIFSDSHTDIILPNSEGVVLRLIAPSGRVVSETNVYQGARDDRSWALLDDVWIFTNQITPAAANLPFLVESEEEVIGVTTVLSPCPAGKYRNPETNRCRTIETAVSSLQPCDEDEYRNPETNRCRKLTTGSIRLEPCPVGQERNPETNRCRRIPLAESKEALPEIIEDPSNAGSTLNWPVIGATFGGTCGYITYEWRNELRRKLASLRAK